MKLMFITFIVGMLLLLGAVVALGINLGLAPIWIVIICLSLAGATILIGSVKMSRQGTGNTTVVHK